MSQPNIAQMTQPGGIVPIDIETTAALVAEIKRQHADLLRKDALLRQVLEVLESSRVFAMSREKLKHPEGTEWYDEAIAAITKELQ